MLIYYFRNPDNVSEATIDLLTPHLPQKQQEILARHKNHRQRCEQVIAYVMLCHALMSPSKKWIRTPGHEVMPFAADQLTPHYLRGNAPLWTFGEHGKPYLVEPRDIYFNISHCRVAVAVAISDSEIGIDIEGPRHFSETLLQRAFSESEQAAIRQAPDPDQEFARLWTRKEAWFKQTGTGILLDHLPSTESDALAANCHITTIPIPAIPIPATASNATATPANASIATPANTLTATPANAAIATPANTSIASPANTLSASPAKASTASPTNTPNATPAIAPTTEDVPTGDTSFWLSIAEA